MTHDELEREIDRLRLAHAKERADHAATDAILRRVREGIMSHAPDAHQRHAIELAFSLLAGSEGNDSAASAQMVAIALLDAIEGWAECRNAHAALIARLDSLAGMVP